MFSHKFINFETDNNKLSKVEVKNLETNKNLTFETDHLILALGHSARDTYNLLYQKKCQIKQKPFAMGVRIEHSQKNLNLAQYGNKYADILPNADYKLVTHLDNGRSVFTFCMCPGGYVVASSSDQGEIVTNGMSNFARDNTNCNSALLVNVTTQDYNSDHPLAGVYFQQKYERLAFDLGGKNFNAPCQTVGSFLTDDSNCKKYYSQINCTYKPNITFAPIKNCLPDFVAESLKSGIKKLGAILNDFDNFGNLLIGIESRSSSPVTICRNQNYQSNISGIYTRSSTIEEDFI